MHAGVGGLDETFDELRGDGLLDEEAGGGRADLPGSEEDANHGPVNRPVQVGIIEDNHRALAAQFQRRGAESFSARVEQRLSGGAASREGELVQKWVLYEMLRRFGRGRGAAGEYVECSCGEARLLCDLAEKHAGQRRQRRGLFGGGEGGAPGVYGEMGRQNETERRKGKVISEVGNKIRRRNEIHVGSSSSRSSTCTVFFPLQSMRSTCSVAHLEHDGASGRECGCHLNDRLRVCWGGMGGEV